MPDSPALVGLHLFPLPEHPFFQPLQCDEKEPLVPAMDFVLDTLDLTAESSVSSTTSSASPASSASPDTSPFKDSAFAERCMLADNPPPPPPPARSSMAAPRSMRPRAYPKSKASPRTVAPPATEKKQPRAYAKSKAVPKHDTKIEPGTKRRRIRRPDKNRPAVQGVYAFVDNYDFGKEEEEEADEFKELTFPKKKKRGLATSRKALDRPFHKFKRPKAYRPIDMHLSDRILYFPSERKDDLVEVGPTFLELLASEACKKRAPFTHALAAAPEKRPVECFVGIQCVIQGRVERLGRAGFRLTL